MAHWVTGEFGFLFPLHLRLRRFLRVNKIEEGLSHRITRFLHYTYHERSDPPFFLGDGGEGRRRKLGRLGEGLKAGGWG